MLEAIIQGVSNVFSLSVFPWIFFGVIVGLIVGILPGIGGSAMLAILIPVIYGKNPVPAITFLVSLHAVVFTGGLATSIPVSVNH